MIRLPPGPAKSEELVAPVWVYLVVGAMLVLCAVVCIVGVTSAHSLNGYGYIMIIVAWAFLILISGVYQHLRRKMRQREKEALGKV
jgi:peptidoglycan/LPS O-acetylase OafA/YrhL